MPSACLATAAPAHELYERLASFGDAPLSLDAARAARARSLSSRLPQRPREARAAFGESTSNRSCPTPDRSRRRRQRRASRIADPRVLVCDLATAAREHPQLLARAFGTTGVAATQVRRARAAPLRGTASSSTCRPTTRATSRSSIRYHAAGRRGDLSVERRARRARRARHDRRAHHGRTRAPSSAAPPRSSPKTHADVTYASLQQPATARARSSPARAARPGRDARVAWACAELGGAARRRRPFGLDRSSRSARAASRRSSSRSGSQHVDVVSTVEHRAGEATSETLVKSAAGERGQARFLGNIRIAPHAQGQRCPPARRRAPALADGARRFGSRARDRRERRQSLSRRDRRRDRRRTDLLHGEPRHRTRRRGAHDRARLLRTGDRALSDRRAARRDPRRARGKAVVTQSLARRDRRQGRSGSSPTFRSSRGRRRAESGWSISIQRRRRKSRGPSSKRSSTTTSSTTRTSIAASTRSPNARPRSSKRRASRSRASSAPDVSEIVWVRNTTEAINLVAYSWGHANLRAGDAILLTELEHHSDLVPWQLLARAHRRAAALHSGRRSRRPRPRRSRRAARRLQARRASRTSATRSERSRRSTTSSRARTPPAQSSSSTARRARRTCRST